MKVKSKTQRKPVELSQTDLGRISAGVDGEEEKVWWGTNAPCSCASAGLSFYGLDWGTGGFGFCGPSLAKHVNH